MSNPSVVLNLDQLSGRARPIIVEYQGKRYEMLRPEALTLEQNNEWVRLAEKLQNAFAKEPNAKTSSRSVTEHTLDEVGRAVDDCIRLLCPAILDEEKPLSLSERIQRRRHPERFAERTPFSFDMKVRALEFYKNEVFAGKATQPTGTAKNSTGARHSHGSRRSTD